MRNARRTENGWEDLYMDSDRGQTYYQSELNFNVPATETAVIEGWVARDSEEFDGALHLFGAQPERVAESFWGIYGNSHATELPHDCFPTVTWESGPKRVKIEVSLIDEL